MTTILHHDIHTSVPPLADMDQFRYVFEKRAHEYVLEDPFSAWDYYHMSDKIDWHEALSLFNVQRHTKFIVVAGPLGGGKTAFVKIMSRVLANTSAYFGVINANIIKESAASYGYQIFEKLGKGMLCINDYGLDGSDTAKHYGMDMSPVDEIIYRRYERGLVTLLTTNVYKEDFFKSCSQRVADRIDGAHVWLKWTPGINYRKPKQS